MSKELVETKGNHYDMEGKILKSNRIGSEMASTLYQRTKERCLININVNVATEATTWCAAFTLRAAASNALSPSEKANFVNNRRCLSQSIEL
jgi:nickel-dependent lactate racemase